jgi:putative transposase
LRAAIGCAIAWGGVGSWWRNAISERLFGTLERFGFQRLPSSMGNGPQDPHRSDNPALEAKGIGIEWHELIQILDVLLANYNATPHSALGNLNPLQHIRQSMNSRQPRWIPRMAPPHTAISPRLGWTILRDKTIAGSVKKRVTPYIEVGEERYTGDSLNKRYDLIGRKCVVHVPENMVTCEAFLATGELLGTLKVLHRGWANTPHSLKDRQAFNRLVREGQNVDRSDPIASLAAYYQTKAVEQVHTNGTNNVSAEASRLADLQSRTGVEPKKPKDSVAINTDRLEEIRRARGINLPKGW